MVNALWVAESLHGVKQWVNDTEDTFSELDPRHKLKNSKTERYKKISLIGGGLFAVIDTLAIASCKTFIYCHQPSPDGHTPFFRISPVSALPTRYPPWTARDGRLSPTIFRDDAAHQNHFNGKDGFTCTEDHMPLEDRTDDGLGDTFNPIYVDENGVAHPARRTFDLRLPSAMALFDSWGLTIQGQLVFFLLLSVIVWFGLKVALFNIIKDKDERLCSCCFPLFKKSVKKLLSSWCGLALNTMMLLHNSLAFVPARGFYEATVSRSARISQSAIIYICYILFFAILAALGVLAAARISKKRTCCGAPIDYMGMIKTALYGLTVLALCGISVWSIYVFVMSIFSADISVLGFGMLMIPQARTVGPRPRPRAAPNTRSHPSAHS